MNEEKKPTQDKTTEALNLILKMREDGRMDEEEFNLTFELIFSDHMDDEMFAIIRFMFKHRPMDQSWLNETYDEAPEAGLRSPYYN